MQNPGFQAATKHTFPGWENRMLRGVWNRTIYIKIQKYTRLKVNKNKEF